MKYLTFYLQIIIFVIEELEAWNPNIRSKTVIRSSNTRHFVDPSIAIASLDLGPNDLINDLKFSWIKNKKKSQSLSNNFSLTTTLNNTFRKKSFYGSLFASLKENKIKNSMSVNKNDLKH